MKLELELLGDLRNFENCDPTAFERRHFVHRGIGAFLAAQRAGLPAFFEIVQVFVKFRFLFARADGKLLGVLPDWFVLPVFTGLPQVW